MPEIFGLTDKGFKAKTMPKIKEELEQALRKDIDASLTFGADSVAGVITAIVANQARQVWESLSGLYHSLQPDTASGRALDALCSLTGTYRKNSAQSKARALMTLAAKAKVPVNSRVCTPSGYSFKTTAEVVNAKDVESDVVADLIAEEYGPFVAEPKTVGKIMTPSTGWSKVVFTETYEMGRLEEEDDALRLRRIEELGAVGASTFNALCKRIEKVPGVLAVHIKEGSHSFEAIVVGGVHQDIAEVIWKSKPIGVGTTGKIKRDVVDETGYKREIRFSRPAPIPLKLEVNLKTKWQLSQAEIDHIKRVVANFGLKQFSLGAEIYPSRFFAPLLAEPSILDVVILQFRDKATGNAVPTTINVDQIATLSFEDIVITSTVESN